jgi:hypothetical protein
MAEIVYGDQAVSEPLQNLVRLFQDPIYSGTLYIGYPILTNIEGTIRVDARYTLPKTQASLHSMSGTSVFGLTML